MANQTLNDEAARQAIRDAREWQGNSEMVCPPEIVEELVSQLEARLIVRAYRDAEGWVLFGSDGEPIEWPHGWPAEIDTEFLEDRGIAIAA